MAGTTQAAETEANAFGRTSTAYTRAIITYSATMEAPAPSPCTALAARNMPAEVAAPARAMPTTNSTTPARNGIE